RQVVAPRAEIHVLSVGLPHDAHAEGLRVEARRGVHVAHPERQVAEAADPHDGRAHETRFYWAASRPATLRPRRRAARERGRRLRFDSAPPSDYVIGRLVRTPHTRCDDAPAPAPGRV